MVKRNAVTKIISVFMSVVMVFGLMPLPAYANEATESKLPPLATAPIDLSGSDGVLTTASDESVPYVERRWDGSQVVSETKNAEATSVPDDGAMTTGWYYLNKDITKKGSINLQGDVNLILGDGFTLDVKGLYIPKGSTLAIYGQTEGTGKIYSHPGDGAAVGAYEDHKGGAVVIHGGQVVAEGGENAAGIGGNDDDRKDVGPITIYGGKVTAEGGEGGAGIGGGEGESTGVGGSVTINGGTVNATGGENAAGVGGGDESHCNTITVNGGDVTATGGRWGAGIGAGRSEQGTEVCSPWRATS